MKKLGYQAKFMQRIWSYHLAMFEWDKNLNTKTLVKPRIENTKCTICVATDIYSMGINNQDVGLVMQ